MKVTVLMPVYNGEKYLTDAILSIINQTFTDFEFLIIDDGSTDTSVDIIKSYRDPRIKLVQNTKNKGLIYTLNKGLSLASGAYIARMDCDDIATPDRLQKQVLFLDRNPEVGICGSWIRLFGVRNEVIRYPIEHEEIKARLFLENMLAHPTVVIRKSFIQNNNLYYDEADLHAEDFGLWQRCSHKTKIVNLPHVLLKYRVHKNSISHVYRESQLETERKLAQKNLALLGVDATPFVLDILFAHSIPLAEKDNTFLISAEDLYMKLIKHNKERKVYSVVEFNRLINRQWFDICYNSTQLGLKTWRAYWTSSLRNLSDISLLKLVKFFLKSTLKR